MVWNGRCGWTFLRPEGRAPVALTPLLRPREIPGAGIGFSSRSVAAWPLGTTTRHYPRAPRGFYRCPDGQPGPLPSRHLAFLCPQFPCPTRLCSRAAPSRAAKQISCGPARPQRVRRARVGGNSHRAIPTSRAATGDRSRSASVAAPPLCTTTCKFLACRKDFSRSAAVCAEHQPQRVGRTGRRRIQPVPTGFRGRCGWSSADTAALRFACGFAALCTSRRSRPDVPR